MADSEAKITEHAGVLSRYGMPRPSAEFAKWGATGSQYYLNLVAEGRVRPVPWPELVEERALHFAGAQPIEFDGIVAGTGFALNLPFLDDATQDTENVGQLLRAQRVRPAPDLPGLAFMGMWSRAGSHPTTLEQQARFLALRWAVRIDRSEPVQRALLAECAARHHRSVHSQAEMALYFARLCGTAPAGQVQPETEALARASATIGLLYRLVGPDAFTDGVVRLRAQVARFARHVHG